MRLASLPRAPPPTPPAAAPPAPAAVSTLTAAASATAEHCSVAAPATASGDGVGRGVARGRARGVNGGAESGRVRRTKKLRADRSRRARLPLLHLAHSPIDVLRAAGATDGERVGVLPPALEALRSSGVSSSIHSMSSVCMICSVALGIVVGGGALQLPSVCVRTGGASRALPRCERVGLPGAPRGCGGGRRGVGGKCREIGGKRRGGSGGSRASPQGESVAAQPPRPDPVPPRAAPASGAQMREAASARRQVIGVAPG